MDNHTRHTLHFRIGPCRDIAPSVSVDGRKELLKDCMMVLDPVKGSTREIPFWETVAINEDVRSIEVRGAWPGRVLTFETRGRMRFGNYAGKPLWNGYSFYARRHKMRFTLTVE